MVIIYPKHKQSGERNPQIIVIFGLGLIGSSIFRSILDNSSKLIYRSIEFCWTSPEKQKLQLKNIFQEITRIAGSYTYGTIQYSILWSAGSAGFSSSDSEVKKELASYRIILDLADQLLSSTESTVDFHLLSSAGGLYEGCSHVDENTVASPCRPYGFLKLEQETLLTDINSITRTIYRPSTVYGPISEGKRKGLISTLIHNGSLGIVSNIMGQLYTLRDYVFYADIAKFIAGKILEGDTSGNLNKHYLISGKPTSIMELKAIIERILRRPLYYRLQYQPDNSCDISFNPSLSPQHWKPSDLYVGCENIYNLWINNKLERTPHLSR